jgi:hypothetical protein
MCDDELFVRGGFAGLRQRLPVVRTEDEKLHIRAFNSPEASLAARPRLGGEVLKTDRLVAQSRDEPRKRVALLL